MKICIITNTFSAELIGGSNIYTELITQELANRNHEVIVIAAHNNKKDAIRVNGNIKIYYFRPLNVATCSTIGIKNIFLRTIWTILDFYNPYSYIKITRILLKEKPNIIHLHTPLDITLSAFDAVKKLKLPLVFTAHDYLLLCPRVILLHASGAICNDSNIHPICTFYRWMARKVATNKPDLVIFPSKFSAEVYNNNNLFRQSKSTILPYPVKLNNDTTGQKNSKNKQYKFRILYVGSLSRHKGIEVLMNAFKKISSDAELLIVGSGRLEERLKEIASMDKRIIFYGKARNDSIEELYNNADVLVVPSVWNEVLGIVILEAFRSSVPVIGSRIGGIPELIKHNVNGFLFDPGDADELKTILENFIKNPSLLDQLSKNTKECVKQHDLQRHIDQLITFYKDALLSKQK